MIKLYKGEEKMAENQYAIAYSEVLEILKYISKEDYNKIPQEKLNVFKTNASKDYKFKYNPEKTLDEQNVSKKAKAIIGLLFRDYWATESQRQKIIRKQNYDRKKIEKEKQENVDQKGGYEVKDRKYYWLMKHGQKVVDHGKTILLWLTDSQIKEQLASGRIKLVEDSTGKTISRE